ncbi:hypothetical protein BDB01DRAFT_418739 [Pilobolus umbonatus]|nr:hypothetical protein BDB01DRAFT_418739 [Pilobolus umbonatus]
MEDLTVSSICVVCINAVEYIYDETQTMVFIWIIVEGIFSSIVLYQLIITMCSSFNTKSYNLYFLVLTSHRT